MIPVTGRRMEELCTGSEMFIKMHSLPTPPPLQCVIEKGHKLLLINLCVLAFNHDIICIGAGYSRRCR